MRCSKAKLAAAIALIGCGSEPSDLPSPPAPVLEAVAAATRPGNVLSVLVTGRARFSVAVRYGLPGAALDSVTPAEQAADSNVTLPVFGLLPDTEYELRLIAYGQDAFAQSELLHITTGSLPADLPRFIASGPSPSRVLSTPR